MKLEIIFAARGACAFAALAFVLASHDARAQPDQKPLMSRQVTAKPNIVLTMDDSGSMLFQNMPDKTVYAGRYRVDLPASVAGFSVTMVPGDPEHHASYLVGTIAATPGSSNWMQKILRSADTNTIYYNPEVSYQPWPSAANATQRMAISNPTAARFNALKAADGTFNLTAIRRTVPGELMCLAYLRSTCVAAGAHDELFDPVSTIG